MSKDVSNLTPEQRLARYKAIEKFYYYGSLLIMLFGFAVVFGVIDLDMPAQYGWIFIVGSILYGLVFKVFVFSKFKDNLKDIDQE